MSGRPVLDKRDMTERWARGEFGNKLRVWSSFEAWSRDLAAGRWPADQTITIRSYEPSSPFCRYDVETHEAADVYIEFVQRGAAPDSLYVNEAATIDHLLVLQGEVRRGVGGLDLRYSTVKKKMRDALRLGEQNAHGLRAKVILDHFLDATSREWLDHLLDEYPDHVVEFSTWSQPQGELGWNTIFWEVRLY